MLAKLAISVMACSLISAVGIGAGLKDRMILEVQKTSFTQREFEAYFYVKQLLLSKNANPFLVLDQENWVAELETFRNEMLVNVLLDTEAQRLSSFYPNKTMVEMAFKMIGDRRQEAVKAREIWRRLQFSESEVRQALARLLKIQSYLKSKVRLRSEDFESKQWGYQLDSNAAWFERIDESYRYRFYQGALTYRPMARVPQP